MWKMFLDDERMPAGDPTEWVICRNMAEVCAAITRHGCMPSFVSFDHDLGDRFAVIDGMPTGDGLDVAKYLCSLDQNTDARFPAGFSWYAHTQNPVGRDNINGYMQSYMTHRLNDDEQVKERELTESVMRDMHAKFDAILGRRL